MSSSLEESAEHREILEWAVEGQGSALIQAVAGSGKTTTLLTTMQSIVQSRVCQSSEILFLAYNKNVVTECESKLASFSLQKMQVRTFHAFGLNLVKKQLGRSLFIAQKAGGNAPKSNIKRLKKTAIVERLCEEHSWDKKHTANLTTLTCMCQDEGLHPQDLLDKFFVENEGKRPAFTERFYSLERTFKMSMEEMIPRVQLILQACYDDEKIDFEDMTWLPAVHTDIDLYCKTKWIVIDEGQDINPSRLQLIKRLREDNPEARFLVAGDDDQSIFGWQAGACNSLRLIQEVLEIPTESIYSLLGCRRCPISHIELAATLLDRPITTDREEDGEIHFADYDDLLESIRNAAKAPAPETLPPGTKRFLVLCRKNKPIAKLAYQLVREGIPAHIIGENKLHEMLLQLLKDWEAQMEDFPTFIDLEKNKNCKKLTTTTTLTIELLSLENTTI